MKNNTNERTPTHKESNTIQAFWLGLGSFASFLFAIISTAVLSQYLDKESYGTYRQVMYVYTTLIIVFTLGLPNAFSFFLSRGTLEEGYDIVKKLTTIFFLLGTIFSLFLYFFSPLIAIMLKNDNLSLSLKYFSVVPLLMLPTMGLEGISATYRKTLLNAIYVIIHRFLSITFVILPVIFYKADANIAILGFSIASLFSCALALYLKKIPFNKVTFKKKTSLSYKEIFTFSLPLFIASIWAIIEKSADQFFISRYFGVSVFAEYANGSLEIPLIPMILSATAVVLLPIFSRMSKQGVDIQEILKLWKGSIVKSSKLIYPIISYCWFFAPIIMLTLYGELYINSAKYFRIMLLINIFTLVMYSPLLLSVGASRKYAQIHIISALSIVVIDYLIIIFFPSPYLITWATIGVRFFKTALLHYAVKTIFKVSIWSLIPVLELMKILVISSSSGVIVWFFFYIIKISSLPITLLSSLLLYIFIYYVSCFLFKISYKEIVNPFLCKIFPSYFSKFIP
jgi:Membrane protein involved in the export of O-antigen and teichoic acid